MNKQVNRTSTVRKIGAGTDTPDSGEPDPEESLPSSLTGSINKNSTIEDEITPCFGYKVEHSSPNSRKKLSTLIEILDEQLDVFQNIMDTGAVRTKAIEAIQLTDELILRQKKFTSVTVAAIIHSVKVLSLPITNKEILSKIECSEKQMKKILIEFNKIQRPCQDSQISGFMKATIKNLGMNSTFEGICQKALQAMEQLKIIESEQDHIIAATVVKTVWDLVIKDENLTISHIAQVGKCCEYSLKKMLKKIQPMIPNIILSMNQGQQQRI